MKGYQFLVVCVTGLVVLFVFQAVVRAAGVISVQGSVQVQSPSDKGWRKAEKGMQLATGDLIRTARNSVAEVYLDAEKKNTLRIEPKSLITLNSGTADTIDRLDLAKGKVYANLEGIKAGLSFEVNTPSAVAGVRGSSYSVYVERDSDEVVAYKDTIFIKAYDVDKKLIFETVLPEGFKTIIDRFAEPGFFSQISAREFNHFDNNMEDLSSSLEGKMSARAQAEESRKEVQRAKETEQDSPQQKAEDVAEQQNIIDQQIDVVQETREDANTQEVIEELLNLKPPCVSCYFDPQLGQAVCPPC